RDVLGLRVNARPTENHLSQRLCDLHPVGPSRIRLSKGVCKRWPQRPYLACIPLAVIPHLSHFVSLVCLKWGSYRKLTGDKIWKRFLTKENKSPALKLDSNLG